VDRAAQLLREVVHGGDPVTFTELTAATGLAKSTTSRLMMALERAGLVRRDGAGRFLPGEMFVSYAWRGGGQAGLVDVARPFLSRVGECTGETVNLGVASRGMVEQVAQVDSRYLIGGTNWVGLSVPLHCAALGKVLLAFGAASLPAGRLEQRTARTITSRGALAADLAAVRGRGYAVTDEELEPGLVAVAAPVFRDGGAVVAALSVSGPASRLSADKIPQVAAQCMAGASALSAALGHAPAATAGRGSGRARSGAGSGTQVRTQPQASREPQARPQREGAA
jgi:DNA-binding IclR family transcriptional regulator